MAFSHPSVEHPLSVLILLPCEIIPAGGKLQALQHTCVLPVELKELLLPQAMTCLLVTESQNCLLVITVFNKG